MRTLIDIPDRQIEDLAMLCDAKQVSRAEIIRQAISAYIEQNKPSTVDAFGIWKSKKVDGLAYQEKMRAEW
ncbi:MAG: ribbon-helix-helix domain-containing protein [Burkholderiaceae bacterium]|nr:ribbon-helix-helix domain-containing protein [Burkholderiaceae bacterium]